MEGRSGGKPPDKRSRNLFGGMLRTLQAAKSQIDKEKGTKSHELRLKAEERSTQRVSDAKLNMLELRKKQFESQQDEERVKMSELDKLIQEKELELLQRRLDKHYSLMMNFIRTQAEPTIFFLPSKLNKEADSKLEETRGAIKHKIASLKVQLVIPAIVEATPEDKERAAAAAAAVEAAEAPPPKAIHEAKPEDNDSDLDSIPDTNKKTKDEKEKDDKEDDKEDAKKDDDDKEEKSDKSGDEDDKKSEKSDKKKSDKDDKSDKSEKSKKSEKNEGSPSKKRKTDDDKDGSESKSGSEE